jgi:uncharacterized protein Yka (UPF0111/DUF47 family)
MSDEDFKAEMAEMGETVDRIAAAMEHDGRQFDDDLDEICELADKIVQEVKGARRDGDVPALRKALGRL